MQSMHGWVWLQPVWLLMNFVFMKVKHNIKSNIGILVSVILCLPFNDILCQEVEKIVNNYFNTVHIDSIRAVKAAYLEVESYYENSPRNYVIPLPAQSNHSIHRTYRCWPGYHKTEVYKDETLIATFYSIEDSASLNFANHYTTLNLKPVKFEFYPILAERYINEGKSIKLVGEKKIDECYFHEIRVKLPGKSFVFLYFDQASGLLNYIKQDNGIITQVSDYKKVNNFLIPFSITKSKDGVKFFESKLVKIDIDECLGIGEFR